MCGMLKQNSPFSRTGGGRGGWDVTSLSEYWLHAFLNSWCVLDYFIKIRNQHICCQRCKLAIYIWQPSTSKQKLGDRLCVQLTAAMPRERQISVHHSRVELLNSINIILHHICMSSRRTACPWEYSIHIISQLIISIFCFFCFSLALNRSYLKY